MEKEERRIYRIEYYKKNKEKLLSRRRKGEGMPLLGDYPKHRYYDYIKQDKPLGRYIREESLFTKEDLIEININKPGIQ